MTQVEGERGAGYVTAEELIQESPASPLFLGGRAKAEPKRKPTVAALAAQQDDIMQALAALSTQVQSLAKSGLGQPTPAQPIAGAALPPAQAPRQVLATQVSASVMAAQSPPRKFADLLGAPPKAMVPKASPLPVADEEARGPRLQSSALLLPLTYRDDVPPRTSAGCLPF